MITRCKYCNKPLALNETAWASRDGMYCSEEHGILDAMSLYTEEDAPAYTIRAKAEAYFTDIAEEISREDYGASGEFRQVYAEKDDITTIFFEVREGDTPLSMECVGWYHGAPDEEGMKKFIDKLTATYVD